jgi:ABC-type branched-subunit amino acid transport system substrate-binding protein
MRAQSSRFDATVRALARTALLLVAGAAAGFAADAPAEGRSIGLLLSTNAVEALSLRQGAAIGVETASRISGVSWKLVCRGQPGQWGSEGNSAAELALDDEVAGLITPADGAAAHQVLQVAGRTRIPVVSLCPDSSVGQAGVPWAARILPQTQDEARALFRHVAGQSPDVSRTYAAFVPPARPGRERAHDLKAAALDAGARLLEPIEVDSASPKAAVKAALAANADVLLLWLDPQVSSVCARELRHAGFKGTLGGASSLNSPAFLTGAGANAEGCVIATAKAYPVSGANFASRYRDRFHTAPDLLALMAHDAVLVLAKLTALPSGESARLVSSISIEGVSGPITFDASGNRRCELEILEFHQHSFRIAAPHAQVALRSAVANQP